MVNSVQATKYHYANRQQPANSVRCEKFVFAEMPWTPEPDRRKMVDDAAAAAAAEIKFNLCNANDTFDILRHYTRNVFMVATISAAPPRADSHEFDRNPPPLGGVDFPYAFGMAGIHSSIAQHRMFTFLKSVFINASRYRATMERAASSRKITNIQTLNLPNTEMSFINN